MDLAIFLFICAQFIMLTRTKAGSLYTMPSVNLNTAVHLNARIPLNRPQKT